MKPMIYSEKFYDFNPMNERRELLAEGEINGYNYWIVSYQTHPCAYIELPVGHEFFGKTMYECERIHVHGGVTFSQSSLWDLVNDSWVIGWDYAHNGDYTSYVQDGHKWTTQEILCEVVYVVRQLERF